MEPEGSLNCPEELANGIYPEAQMYIINMSFYFILSSYFPYYTLGISLLYPLCKPI